MTDRKSGSPHGGNVVRNLPLHVLPALSGIDGNGIAIAVAKRRMSTRIKTKTLARRAASGLLTDAMKHHAGRKLS